MAVALPPIDNAKHGKNERSYSQSSRRSTNVSATERLPRVGNRKERELYEKKMGLRALQKHLTKAETAQYRYSYKHNMCLDMLREGFHLSFKELFLLIQRQNEERLAAGAETLMWTLIMLQDEYDKLDTLRRYLTTAETSFRKGDYSSVYEARFELANYFQQMKDKWLADHFFQTCLETAALIETDSGKTKAEGHCNFGITLEENSVNYDAAKHFEAYYNLAKGHKEDWVKEDIKRGPISFFTDACIHLYRINTTIGNELEQQGEMSSCVQYHVKALENSKESGDKKLEGEASYRLGMTYETMGNLETALLHLNTFYNSCKISKDSEGLGRACDAIAKAYARMGVKDQSIEYLKEFVETAEATGMDAELAKACHNLGNIFNSLGNYKEAGEYFNRAYNISRAMGDSQSIQINRVQSGIAQAHAMLGMYSTVVVNASESREYLERTVDWKSIRANIYEPKADKTGKPAAVEPSPARATEPTEEKNPVEEPQSSGQSEGIN